MDCSSLLEMHRPQGNTPLQRSLRLLQFSHALRHRRRLSSALYLCGMLVAEGKAAGCDSSGHPWHCRQQRGFYTVRYRWFFDVLEPLIRSAGPPLTQKRHLGLCRLRLALPNAEIRGLRSESSCHLKFPLTGLYRQLAAETKKHRETQSVCLRHKPQRQAA